MASAKTSGTGTASPHRLSSASLTGGLRGHVGIWRRMQVVVVVLRGDLATIILIKVMLRGVELQLQVQEVTNNKVVLGRVERRRRGLALVWISQRN